MSDFRSRVLGTIIGILSRGSFPKWEPVAWLYNGVRLPGLPVVDTAKYPKLLIHTQINNEDGTLRQAYFRGFADNAYYSVSDEGNLILHGDAVVATLSGDAWSSPQEYTDYSCRIPPAEGWTFRDIYTEYLTWANFKVEHGGTVYMEPSDPVPGYE